MLTFRWLTNKPVTRRLSAQPAGKPQFSWIAVGFGANFRILAALNKTNISKLTAVGIGQFCQSGADKLVANRHVFVSRIPMALLLAAIRAE